MSIPQQQVLQALSRIANLLARLRLDITQEKRAQADLEQVLTTADIPFEREKRLSEKDIPDFLLNIEGVGIVIELKTRAQRKSIYRQLERYAQHAEVDGLILFTGTPMGLPATINDKPARTVSMGAGWI